MQSSGYLDCSRSPSSFWLGFFGDGKLIDVINFGFPRVAQTKEVLKCRYVLRARAAIEMQADARTHG
jgi:hypothetical protein